MGPIIQEWVFRIITEEVLGINTVLGETFNGALPGWRGLFACMDPDTKSIRQHYSGAHLAMGFWMKDDFANMIRQETENHPDLVPIALGSVGYKGSNGIFVPGSAYSDALQQHYLPMDFYMSYSNPAINPAQYFDPPSSIDANRLRPCEETLFADVSAYAMVANDTEGMIVTHGPEGTTYSARCTGRWWYSPACRRDPARCVPIITAGNGWSLLQMMQWVEAWQVPAAIAVTKDRAAYGELPMLHRMIFYWWVPDNSFVGLDERKLIWPRHNPLDKARTDTPETDVVKFACAGLENTGFSRALGLLRNMKILLPEIMELGQMVAARQGDTEAVYESVACEWLNNHQEKYSAWIPLSTACVAQQGLVSENGSFVALRADATNCEWCAPGRMSKPLSDSSGNTHRCEACSEGAFQKSLGKTNCDQCEEGTFAAVRGAQSCQRCPLGKFADQLGQSECQACPTGMLTPFEGARSADVCLCPADSYRDSAQRNLCLPCKEGMTCPMGADMLGYQPEHAAQYPIVPLLKPGFWSSREEPLSIFRCQDDLRCPGERRPGSLCAGNFVRQRCGACKDGYALIGSECVKCAAPQEQAMLFPIAPLGLLVIFICLIYKRDGASYQQWDSWTKGATATVFILLNCYHVVNIIYSLDVTPRQSVSNLLNSVTFLSDVLSIFRPQCSGLSSSWSQLVLASHSAAFVFLIYLTVWLVSWIVGFRATWLRMEPNRLLNGYYSIILTFFASVTQRAFTVFKCSGNPNGVYTLLADRSITCYEGEWLTLVAIGISAVLLWCVGLTVLMLHAICVASTRFHKKVFQTRWAFLFMRFRPDVHWWALTIVARGLVLNMGSLFLSAGVVQVYWIFLVLIAYTGLLFVFRPWRHVLNNYVDSWMSFCLFFICAIAVWFSHEDVLNIEAQNMLGEHLLKVVLALAALPLCPVVGAMWWRAKSSQAQRKKEMEVQVIMHAITQVASGDFERRIQFLKNLTENDFHLMCRAKDMLMTELGRKKVRRGYSVKELSRLSVNAVVEDAKKRLKQLQEGGSFHDMAPTSPRASMSSMTSSARRNVSITVDGFYNPMNNKQVELNSNGSFASDDGDADGGTDPTDERNSTFSF